SDAITNPVAQLSGTAAAEELLANPVTADPLREHDMAPTTDGAAVMILASTERARDIVARPAAISGIEHRVDSPALGARDLTRSTSTESAAQAVSADTVDLAEVHAPFTHQELILRQAMGLDERVRINPSGGALTGNAMFSAGLSRIGEAATRITNGEADRALGHATS